MLDMIRTFADAHRVLHSFYNIPGTNTYTLDRMQALMEYLGNPQDKLCIVHVAGTSGKTSTSYYVAGLLCATGASVGLTVSPHVDEVNERVQINGIPLPEVVFCKDLNDFIDVVHDSGITPSYFELLTAFAYWEFARQGLDYAVMEVGLGGLLDATNVVSRKDKVCVITDLGLDHVDILGKTLPEITKQKAGIITEGNHVFIHKQDLEVMHVIEEVCRQNSAVLHTYSSDKDDFLAELRLPLFQQRNMHLAIQVAAYVLDRDKQSKLTREQIRGVASIQVPARMEIFKLVGKTLIIDGSHNSQKLRALTNSISSEFHNQSIYALVAFVSGDDQRWQTGLDVLMYLVDGLIVTSFTSNQDFPKQSVDPDKIVEYCHKQGFTNLVVEKEPEKAFGLLTKQSQDLLLVTGSFYLLNHIRPLIKVI